MAGKFKYDINPLILKTLWEQAPTPGLDEAISEFNRIHKPVHKSWKPEIKIPSLQINKVYLNGIVVLAFSLLFIYLIFFKGFSGKSEKNEQNIQRVKVLSGPPTTHSSTSTSTSSIDNNKEQKNSVIKDSSSARVNTNVKSPVSTSHSTISPDSLVSSQKTKNTPVSIPVDEKSEKKDSIITSSSNDKDSLNVTANQKNKKKKKKKIRKKVEAEILEKSPDWEEILLPSSTSQEREPEIRP